MSVKDRVSSGVAAVTEHGPVVAHLIRMLQHYGKVNAKLHAGAITFFGFLSMFPLLALLAFSLSVIATVAPQADNAVQSAVNDAFPGVIGGETGVSMDQVRTFSGWSAVAGLAGVLVTGLGFIQVLRVALMYVFERPIEPQAFLSAKIADLLGLLTVGGTLILSILAGSVLTRFSRELLELVQLDARLGWLLSLIALAVGMAINVILFFVMFRQLGRPDAPWRALAGGALLGAVGFEVLKQVSTQLIVLTQGNPAFQAFGIALVVVVLLNYFARLVLYAASWAHTSPAAMAARPDRTELVQGPQSPHLGQPLAEDAPRRGVLARWAPPFAAGGAAMLGLVAALRRRGEE